ncbi:MAG: signal peptidase II [Clostridia bacterium]|nr:signal peptidase II [Clostridia bacterium]
MIWIIIIIIALILDQLSKFLVINNIGLGVSNAVIENFFYLTYVRNKGAAWSILQNGRYFFLIITPIILAVLGFYLTKSKNKLLNISISFIIGGAIGNYIDRLFRVSVVDFLEFHFGSYIFPIFNIADCFIVVGTFLLGYYLIFLHKDNNEEKIEAE